MEAEDYKNGRKIGIPDAAIRRVESIYEVPSWDRPEKCLE